MYAVREARLKEEMAEANRVSQSIHEEMQMAHKQKGNENQQSEQENFKRQQKDK